MLAPVRACLTSAKRDVNGNAFVTAKHVTTGRRKRVPWDDTLDEKSNHVAVARLVLGAAPTSYASVDGGGYLFTVDPTAGLDPNALEDS